MRLVKHISSGANESFVDLRVGVISLHDYIASQAESARILRHSSLQQSRADICLRPKEYEFQSASIWYAYILLAKMSVAPLLTDFVIKPSVTKRFKWSPVHQSVSVCLVPFRISEPKGTTHQKGGRIHCTRGIPPCRSADCRRPAWHVHPRRFEMPASRYFLFL
jgi:hypothetical protein